MKKIFKKNQIIITALAVMIAAAGYISYSDAQIKGKKDKTAKTETASETETSVNMDQVLQDMENLDLDVTDETGAATAGDGTDATASGEESSGTESQPQETPGEAVLTGASTYMAQARIEREQIRSQNKESLLSIINNEALSETEKESAIASMVNMTDLVEKEAAAELLLEAKGFPDVVVNLTGETADIVVPDTKVDDASRAQIEDIVKRKTDTGGNFLYRDSKTAGTMAVNDLGLNNGTKGLFLTASGNTAGENTKWWNGAMKAIAIVDSNGEKGSTKTYSYVNSWFETGVMGQTGCQAIAFCDENGKMICCQEIYKNDMSGNTAHMAMWVGGNNPRIVKDYSFEPVYWDSNPFNRNQGHSDMMKWDDTIRFHWCGSYPEYKVPELKNTKVHSVKLYIGQYGNRNMNNQYVWRNVFRGISVRISDITKWRDAPNKFTTNEIFRVDCGSGDVTLQGLARPDLGALGNDWEAFCLTPGVNQIQCIHSSWAKQPTYKMKYREVFL